MAVPFGGGIAVGAAARTPQSTVVSLSTLSRVTPVPSAFAVQSSSWNGPVTSCTNASCVPSGDHDTSQTSPVSGTRTALPPPSGCTTLIPPEPENAIRVPSGDQDG